jgi:hypothetical protein
MAGKKAASGLSPESNTERRSQSRQRVLKGAIIHFNKGYGALECVVRNLSPDGARLAFGETTAVPPAFELKIAGSDTVRQARVRWRTVDSVGASLA